MLEYPNINPIAFSIGSFDIYWYGLMYLFGILSTWYLGYKRAKKNQSIIKPEQVGDIIFYAAIGILIGGRIGYTVFYNLTEFIHNPLIIFHIRDGGMSFHGGFAGVLIATYVYLKRQKINFVFFIYYLF